MSKIIKLLFNGKERAILCMFTLAHRFTFEFCTATTHYIHTYISYAHNTCINTSMYEHVYVYTLYEVCVNLISYWCCCIAINSCELVIYSIGTTCVCVYDFKIISAIYFGWMACKVRSIGKNLLFVLCFLFFLFLFLCVSFVVYSKRETMWWWTLCVYLHACVCVRMRVCMHAYVCACLLAWDER